LVKERNTPLGDPPLFFDPTIDIVVPNGSQSHSQFRVLRNSLRVPELHPGCPVRVVCVKIDGVAMLNVQTSFRNLAELVGEEVDSFVSTVQVKASVLEVEPDVVGEYQTQTFTVSMVDTGSVMDRKLPDTSLVL